MNFLKKLKMNILIATSVHLNMSEILSIQPPYRVVT